MCALVCVYVSGLEARNYKHLCLCLCLYSSIAVLSEADKTTFTMNGHARHVVQEEEEEAPVITNTNQQGNVIWESYRSFVRQNRTSLELLDAGLSRILFWTPNGDKNGGERHRQVFYGILSLHRLAMDAALQQQQQQQQQQQEDDYGTTVRPNPADIMDQGSKFPLGLSPTAMRMALTVLQSLLPSILELSSQSSSQAARARLHIERAKFALRLALLGSYWKRLRDSQNGQRKLLVDARAAEYQPQQPSPPLSIGLLTEGGFFHATRPSVPTLQQEHWEWEKRSYVGRRTGRKVTKRTMQGGDSLYSPQQQQQQQQQQMPFAHRISTALQNNNNLHVFSVMLGELLYAYRPLYWAATEATGQASYRSWALAIIMDLVSLQMCQRTTETHNAATRAELKRRKMRLLLYLLREPLWDNVTGPSSERVGDALDKVPLLGRLVSTYFRDWLWYMKHPYVSEEG
jgi:Peroxisomal membrane protein (Pex16)